MNYIGIDLGGTNVAAGVVTEKGELLGKASVPTPRGAEAVADAIALAARQAAGATGVPLSGIKAIGLTAPGSIDPETGVADRSKIALAISFNTTGFHVDENGLLVDATFYHPSTATIAKRLGQSDSVRVWDETARNPYLEYTTEDGERYKLWYEDAQSITEKLQLARMFGVTGFSVWRLGMIPDDPALPHYNVQDVFADF